MRLTWTFFRALIKVFLVEIKGFIFYWTDTHLTFVIPEKDGCFGLQTTTGWQFCQGHSKKSMAHGTIRI